MPLRRGWRSDPGEKYDFEKYPPSDREKAEAEEYADYYATEKHSEQWHKLYHSKLKTLRNE